jgi:hypothetical protein
VPRGRLPRAQRHGHGELRVRGLQEGGQWGRAWVAPALLCTPLCVTHRGRAHVLKITDQVELRPMPQQSNLALGGGLATPSDQLRGGHNTPITMGWLATNQLILICFMQSNGRNLNGETYLLSGHTTWSYLFILKPH